MEKEGINYDDSLNPTKDDAKSSMASTIIEPNDTFLFNYFIFLLLGIVMILPFNALIQSIGFFEANLPGRDIEFVVSTLTNVPVFVGQILMLFLARWFNIKGTILFSLVVMGGLWISIPFLTEHITSANVLWYVIIGVIALFSLFNGILQSWGYGYAGVFPQRIIASLSNGTGLSGVVVGLLRAISLVSFPTDNSIPRDPNLFTGAILYFSISTALCLVLTGLIMVSYRTDYSLFYSSNKEENQHQNRIDSIDNMMRSHQNFAVSIDNRGTIAHASTTSVDIVGDLKPSIIKIHNDHWINLWGIFINFVVTFVIYPGLLLQGNVSFIEDEDWRIWFVIFLFTVFDTIGRVIAGFLTLKSPIVWGIFTVLRFGNVAVAFLSAYDISFFGSDIVVVINIILSSFGLGYVLTWQVIMALTFPQPHEMETAGKIVNIFLQVGIVVGSLIATFGLSQLF